MYDHSCNFNGHRTAQMLDRQAVEFLGPSYVVSTIVSFLGYVMISMNYI